MTYYSANCAVIAENDDLSDEFCPACPLSLSHTDGTRRIIKRDREKEKSLTTSKQ